jgi:hypothetical protein
LPPNVQFSSKRLSKGHEDKEMGRQKAIYAELLRRGLIVPKEKKFPKKKKNKSGDRDLLSR